MKDLNKMSVAEINRWCLSGPRHDSEQVRRAAAMDELARQPAPKGEHDE